MYKFEIVDIRKAYLNAYRSLVASIDVDALVLNSRRSEIIDELWYNSYGSRVIRDVGWGHMKSLEFVSELECTLFVLRWS